jgi:hypothetical protein
MLGTILVEIRQRLLTSVIERLAVPAHKLLACAVSGARRTARSAPSAGRTSPITTEGGVNDGKVVLEKLPRIAGGRRVVSHRLVPSVGERSTIGDISGDLVSREEVNRNARVVPFHYVDPSAGVVERNTEAVIRGVVLHTAPTVSSLVRSAVRSSIEGADRSRGVGGYGATGPSVN